jgi:hypothetical protein
MNEGNFQTHECNFQRVFADKLLILTVHNISAVTFKIRTAIVNININNIP